MLLGGGGVENASAVSVFKKFFFWGGSGQVFWGESPPQKKNGLQETLRVYTLLIFAQCCLLSKESC